MNVTSERSGDVVIVHAAPARLMHPSLSEFSSSVKAQLGGGERKVAIAWMGNDHALPGNDAEAAGPNDPWNVYIAQTQSGLGCVGSTAPGFRTARATPAPFHSIAPSNSISRFTTSGGVISGETDGWGRFNFTACVMIGRETISVTSNTSMTSISGVMLMSRTGPRAAEFVRRGKSRAPRCTLPVIARLHVGESVAGTLTVQ